MADRDRDARGAAMNWRGLSVMDVLVVLLVLAVLLLASTREFARFEGRTTPKPGPAAVAVPSNAAGG